MGLSMHLYRKQKVSEEVADSLDGKNLDYIPENLFWYTKEDVDNNHDIFKDLMPLLTKVTMIATDYDIDNIKLDNGIPENAVLVGTDYLTTETIFTFCSDDKKSSICKKVTINDDDKYQYLVCKPFEAYICEGEKVYQWRNAHEVQDYIYNAYGDNIKNFGYYLLDSQILKDMIDKGYIESDLDGNLENIFYQEWN